MGAKRRGLGNRKVVIGGSGVVAIVLCVAATAWACTAIHGTIKICSPTTGTCTDTAQSLSVRGKGAVGSTIKVTATALKPKPAKYTLYFAPAAQVGNNCHNATRVLSSPAGTPLLKMTTNANGALDKDLAVAGIQAYKATIPADAPSGDAVICAREKYPTPENSATPDMAFFTVIGGTG